VIYRTESKPEDIKERRMEDEERKINQKRLKKKRRLTSPDDSAHRAEGVFPACCWSAPPRWSPGLREEAQEVRERTQEVSSGRVKRRRCI